MMGNGKKGEMGRKKDRNGKEKKKMFSVIGGMTGKGKKSKWKQKGKY